MKKFRIFVLLLVLFGFSLSLFAEEPVPTPREKALSIGGAAAKETFESLKSAGVLKLNGTTVKKTLEVQGALLAHSAMLGSVEVLGEANLTDTVISESSKITGYLRANASVFKGPLLLSVYKAVFTASKIASITVQKQEAFKGKQIIELKQGTIVDGPIVFEAGKGEVHLYSGSKVYAPIEGGKLIRKN